MATWITTLPQKFEQNGFSETIEDNVLRTSPQWGLDITRPQTTLDKKRYSGTMTLTESQKVQLDNFYRLYKGVLFEFPDQFNDDPYGTRVYLDVKFVGAPSYSADSDRFKASFSVEFYG